ncbi:MAG TPA: N-acyl homoserine lactonase family protein [Thermoleophilaceae bacterium]|nr:N-acyl homoserine lactonase family protein [Thermoleophilaceae bacterium]
MAATVRLHPLLGGTAAWPEAWAHRADGPLRPLRAIGIGSKTVPIPLPAFLVEHPTEGPILIDAGLHPSMEFGPVLGMFAARSFRLAPDGPVPDQLRARGVDPADVKQILITHLHLDHASGIRQFPGATLVVSQSEWRAFNGRNGTLNGYVRSHVPDDAPIRELELDGAYASFERSADVLGDGSVVAVYTPGHTAGHTSYVLRTEGGEVLVAGDAVYTRHTLETGHLPTVMANEERFEASLDQIRRYDGGLVIPGHDMVAWDALEAVY